MSRLPERPNGRFGLNAEKCEGQNEGEKLRVEFLAQINEAEYRRAAGRGLYGAFLWCYSNFAQGITGWSSPRICPLQSVTPQTSLFANPSGFRRRLFLLERFSRSNRNGLWLFIVQWSASTTRDRHQPAHLGHKPRSFL